MQIKSNHISAIIVCVFGLFLVLYLNYTNYYNKQSIDTFADASESNEKQCVGEQNPANIQLNIIDLYGQLLNRQPSREELVRSTRDIESGNISIYGLKQSILDSPEYKNLSKLQSNSLNPELAKMVSDKQIIDKIAKIYKNEFDSDIPPKMVLPLRDVYIYLHYNKYALVAMFRNYVYPSFEADCMNTPDLNHNQTMDIFNEYFSRTQLLKAGNAIIANKKCVAKKQNKCIGKDTSVGSSYVFKSNTSSGGTDLNMVHTGPAPKPAPVPVSNNAPAPKPAPVPVSNNAPVPVANNTPDSNNTPNFNDDENFTLQENFTTECSNSYDYDETPCAYLSTPDYCAADSNKRNTGKTLENLLYDAGARTPNPLSEVEQAQLNYNKNLAARQMAEGNFNIDFNTDMSKTEYKIPVQKGPYIILPELAWSVPQPRAPVCTTLGQAPLIQPVMTQSKLLLQGLPVDQAAKDTGVGSIMPKFQMQEYITVNSY